MTIPYNEAGKTAFDVFCSVAEKLYTAARESVDDYIVQFYPETKTLSEKHENGRYCRTIIFTTGEIKEIHYDYRSKSIEVVKESRKKARSA